MFSVGDRNVHNPIDQGGHWQQFGTPPILICVPQWLHRPCNAPTQFYRVSKKSSVKADLAMHSHVADVSGQCMSVSLINKNLKRE